MMKRKSIQKVRQLFSNWILTSYQLNRVGYLWTIKLKYQHHMAASCTHHLSPPIVLATQQELTHTQESLRLILCIANLYMYDSLNEK